MMDEFKDSGPVETADAPYANQSPTPISETAKSAIQGIDSGEELSESEVGEAKSFQNVQGVAINSPETSGGYTSEIDRTQAFNETNADLETNETSEFLRYGELEPNTTYERGGCVYETDDQGRVSMVSGPIHLAEGKRTLHQTEVGHQGLETDEGGHLIGAQFNGSPEGVNLVPQDMNLNRSDWRRMEEEWASALREGSDVEVFTTLQYEGDDSRPMAFHVLYTIDGGKTQERQFINIAHGELN